MILDEVITGFRLGPNGAAGLYDVTPDLATYGKVIGGGMPVGAYGGSRELMEQLAPLGPVYQAGTLSGQPGSDGGGRCRRCKRFLADGGAAYAELDRLGAPARNRAVRGHASLPAFRGRSLGSARFCGSSSRRATRPGDSTTSSRRPPRSTPGSTAPSSTAVCRSHLRPTKSCLCRWRMTTP